MIPNQWYPVFESKRLRRKPVALTRFSEPLVLWRDATGRAVCMRDRCPHRGVALSRGRVDGGELECPYHGFRFASDGTCTRMPCEGKDARIPKTMCATTYDTVEKHGLVWVFWGDASRARPEIPWFDEVGEAGAGTADGVLEWPMNFVRTLETNFDVHHFPFAHRSLSFGVGERVADLEVATSGTHIVLTGRLAREDQLDDRRAGWPVRIEHKAPAVTLLGLGEKMVGVIADCPIDDDHTWRFMRYRQRYTRLPVVGTLLAWLTVLSEIKLVQPQDLYVLETQTPARPDEGHDRLVRADLGTAAYLKLRRRMLAEARGVHGAERALPVVDAESIDAESIDAESIESAPLAESASLVENAARGGVVSR